MSDDELDNFIRIWQMAESLEEACKALNQDARRASNAAANLRRRGVPLKNFIGKSGGRTAALSRDSINWARERARVWGDCFEAEQRRKRNAS